MSLTNPVEPQHACASRPSMQSRLRIVPAPSARSSRTTDSARARLVPRPRACRVTYSASISPRSPGSSPVPAPTLAHTNPIIPPPSIATRHSCCLCRAAHVEHPRDIAFPPLGKPPAVGVLASLLIPQRRDYLALALVDPAYLGHRHSSSLLSVVHYGRRVMHRQGGGRGYAAYGNGQRQPGTKATLLPRHSTLKRGVLLQPRR